MLAAYTLYVGLGLKKRGMGRKFVSDGMVSREPNIALLGPGFGVQSSTRNIPGQERLEMSHIPCRTLNFEVC